jgi:hypothetical protein
MELIAEFLFQMFLIFPGAFIRWMFRGFKGSYSEQIAKNSDSNILISVAFVGIVVLLIKFLK